MYRHLLVPIDGSDLSVETAAKATALAKTLTARVTFFHARPEADAPENAATAHAIIAKAVTDGQTSGVPCRWIQTTNSRPYQAILDAAQAQGCDLIFMASHGQRGARGLELGPQTQKVLAHTTIPVLVSAVECNAESPDMRAAVDVLRGEHRSLSAVVHGLAHLVQGVRERQTAPDLKLIEAILNYIEAFPIRLHHPKEDKYLFSALRRTTTDFGPVLAELEADHATEAQRLAELRQTFAGYAAGAPGGYEDFAGEVDRFAQATWHHMTLEEKVILPAAQRNLSAADWNEIARAFASNEDPRFTADLADGYQKLYARIREFEAEGAWNVGPR